MHRSRNGAIGLLFCIAAVTSTAQAERAAPIDQQKLLQTLNIDPLADETVLSIHPAGFPTPFIDDATGDPSFSDSEPAVAPLPPAILSASSTLLAAGLVSTIRKRRWRR